MRLCWQTGRLPVQWHGEERETCQSGSKASSRYLWIHLANEREKTRLCSSEAQKVPLTKREDVANASFCKERSEEADHWERLVGGDEETRDATESTRVRGDEQTTWHRRTNAHHIRILIFWHPPAWLSSTPCTVRTKQRDCVYSYTDTRVLCSHHYTVPELAIWICEKEVSRRLQTGDDNHRKNT